MGDPPPTVVAGLPPAALAGPPLDSPGSTAEGRKHGPGKEAGWSPCMAEGRKGGGSSSMAEGRKKAGGASLASIWRRRESGRGELRTYEGDPTYVTNRCSRVTRTRAIWSYTKIHVFGR